MALLQKKPHISTSIPLFNTSLSNRTVLCVGLGNPKSKYHRTRHNIGFDCINHFAHSHDFAGWREKSQLLGYETSQNLGDTRVLLLKPTTYMNRSGQAVRAAIDFYKLSPDNVIAIYDDIDVSFGTLKTRLGGGSAGHNGVKSLIEHIGADFGRLRIGIGPKQPAEIDSADFVLAPFGETELPMLPAILKESTALLTEFVFSGDQLQNDTRTTLL
jgi:peptidyl-tRNA hydrolase, PTH1 family